MKTFIKRLLELLSSKELLIWLIILWVGYYLTTAVWWNEAFSHFVLGLKDNPISQGLYMVVVINLVLRLAMTMKEGRLQVIRKAPLLLGLIIFLSGFFLSITTRNFSYVLLGEGDRYSPIRENYVLYVDKITAPLKEKYLDLEEEKGFFKYEPEAFVSDGERRWRIVPYPPKKIGNAYYHILDFGIAPGVRLTEGDKILQEGYVVLRLLPPGNQDYFEITPYPYRFYIKLAPDRVVEKGRVIGRSFNLKVPRYDLKILRGEEIVAEGISDGKIGFNGLSLNFFEPTYWVRMEVVRDMGLPIIAAGIILIVIGIPLRLIGRPLKIKEE